MKKKNKDKPLRGRPRAFDTDAALDAAMHVFWQNGFLGTSLSDLTQAMGINRASIYAAFGNKESLFRQVVQRYLKGPSKYVEDALKAPTARAVAEQFLHGVVDLVTDPRTPQTCLWVHGALSCGDPSNPLKAEFEAQRADGQTQLRQRFTQAIAEGDLPSGTDASVLASMVQTLIYGVAVMAATGASRKELLHVVAGAIQSFFPPV